MKKIVPQTLDPEQAEAKTLARLIPIRTETTLSRRPIHRLSKKGTIKIKEVKKNARGKLVTTWEVRNAPGPLAYKVDKLIIDRRLYEAHPEIPKLLKLGSLREMCEALDITEGKGTQLIKEALYQNAGALIIARLEYTGKDGTERHFEFGSSRYAVYFVGEKLPDGRTADAVYVRFHDDYYALLKHSQTRPLDYEYLKSLPPASQRVYELISFAIFGAIRHGRECATYLYSELCCTAPLTRHYKWDAVRSQMWKVHKPHKESGYLKAVDFEETTDAEGQSDWVIRYTPGRKARHEFKEFTTKREKQITVPPRPRLVEAKPEERREETASITPERTPEDKAIIEKLMSHGIDASRAARLVEGDRAECELWVNAWPHQNQKGMDNPPAVLASFIEKKRRPIPKGYKEAREREERHKQHEQEQARQRAGENYCQFFEPQFRAHQQAELKAIEEQHPEEYAAFKAHFDKVHAKGARMITGNHQRERYTLRSAAEYFNQLQPELGLRLSTFDEWDEQHNAESCDPLEWFNRDPQKIFEELERRFKEL